VGFKYGAGETGKKENTGIYVGKHKKIRLLQLRWDNI
jgi:hypothetical protein